MYSYPTNNNQAPQGGAANTGQTIVIDSAIFDGPMLDATEPVFRRILALTLLGRSFLWSMIGLSGNWFSVFVKVDHNAPWFSNGYINTPGLFWSGYMMHIHILAILAGLLVQGTCTYVQYVYRNRKNEWPYRIALTFDIAPDFWASWTFIGVLIVGMLVPTLSFWIVMPIVVVLLFTPTFFGAILPEPMLVRN